MRKPTSRPQEVVNTLTVPVFDYILQNTSSTIVLV